MLKKRFGVSKADLNFGIKVSDPRTGKMDILHMPDDRIIHGALPLSWSPMIISLLNGKVKLNAAEHRQGIIRSEKEKAQKMSAYLKFFGLPA